MLSDCVHSSTCLADDFNPHLHYAKYFIEKKRSPVQSVVSHYLNKATKPRLLLFVYSANIDYDRYIISELYGNTW